MQQQSYHLIFDYCYGQHKGDEAGQRGAAFLVHARTHFFFLGLSVEIFERKNINYRHFVLFTRSFITLCSSSSVCVALIYKQFDQNGCGTCRVKEPEEKNYNNNNFHFFSVNKMNHYH